MVPSFILRNDDENCEKLNLLSDSVPTTSIIVSKRNSNSLQNFHYNVWRNKKIVISVPFISLQLVLLPRQLYDASGSPEGNWRVWVSYTLIHSQTHNPPHTMTSLTDQLHTKESIYESNISAIQEIPALYEERRSITVLTQNATSSYP